MILLIAALLALTPAHADVPEPLNTAHLPAQLLPKDLASVYVERKTGAQIPLNLAFRDELGRPVVLSQIVRDHPVILTLNYFRCPGLCSLILNGVVQAIGSIPQKLGRDFQVLTVSIDPNEGSSLARSKKRSYLARYGISTVRDDAPGWRMLTGTSDSIKKLADAVGFHYVYEPRYGKYSHPSVVMILNPEGKIGNYLFGTQYSPVELSRDLEQAAGNIEVTSESVIPQKNEIASSQPCFPYDPLRGGLSEIIMWAVRLSTIAMAFAVAGLILSSFLRESKRRGPA